jgi:hypothetical protein
MEKGKLIRLVEFGIAFILAFISFLLIITYGANDLVIIFLSAIVILTFLPVGLKFKDERENDIFHFKYYTPISLGLRYQRFF